jgi:hypothetical protein
MDGTGTSGVSLNQLRDESVPVLMGYGSPLNSAWFQQAGGKPQITNVLFGFLLGGFEERVLLNMYLALIEEGFSWPPTSPNSNTCNDYVLG